MDIIWDTSSSVNLIELIFSGQCFKEQTPLDVFHAMTPLDLTMQQARATSLLELQKLEFM